jgi:hypothetical protein
VETVQPWLPTHHAHQTNTVLYSDTTQIGHDNRTRITREVHHGSPVGEADPLSGMRTGTPAGGKGVFEPPWEDVGGFGWAAMEWLGLVTGEAV